MKIFLVGYMGCGKTTLSRKVASQLEMRCVDTDVFVEQKAGESIADIFARSGEEGFREVERSVLEQTIEMDEALIVATGGGLPTYKDNMELINSSGVSIYLKLTPRALVSRLEKGKHKRPIIANKSNEELEEFIEGALGKREEYYSKATMTIDCTGVSDKYIIEHIIDWIKYKLNR